MMPGPQRCRFTQVLVILTIFCVCPFEALPCNWITEAGQKLVTYISGDPKNVTLEEGHNNLRECQKSCIEESTFICAAVNYRQSDRRCELLEENDQTAVPQDADGYQYSLRPICAGFWQPWTAHKGRYLDTGEDQKIDDTDTDNLRSCMRKCVQHVGGKNCSSIIKSVKSKMINNDTCELISTKPDDGLRTKQSDEWQYFKRPSWYLDNAPGAETLTVGRKWDRGTDFAILNNNPLEADGYLVAWQYYTRSDGIPCPTYAAVWSGSGRGYQLIGETLLTYGRQDSITFHYISGKIIRVEKGYLPSTYVRNVKEKCAGNLISYWSLGTYGEYGKMELLKNVSVGDVLNDVKSEQREVSFRPFIAEYLVVTKLSVNISKVLAMEANIHWGDPVGYLSLKSGQQNITGGGFQLTCSTSDTFSNGSLVPCFGEAASSLRPVSARSAILSLPDYTHPHYVRIEVVRNFNGNKLVDEKHKDLGLFCARRPMLTDETVEVKDSGILRPGEQRDVSLKTSLNDSCVQSVIISDKSGELANGSNATNEWHFSKPQGAQFTINITVNLFGGYQQVVWTGEHMTKRVPGAPADPRVTERRRNSAKMVWDAVKNYKYAIITKYQVDCTVSNDSFNIDADLGYSDNLTFTTDAKDVTALQVDGLFPQVLYSCWVKALLENDGYGYNSSFIPLWTKPQYPALNISSTSVETFVYSGNATITLPNVTMIDKFDQRFASIWIVVRNGEAGRRNRSTTTTTLTIDGTNTYIAAKIGLLGSGSTFIVGDGETYGGKTNKELKIGNYTIYVGYQAVTEEEVTEFYQLNEKPLTVIVPTTAPPTLLIVGIVVGVAVVIVVILVVIFLKHRNKPKRYHAPGIQAPSHDDSLSEDAERPLQPVKPVGAIKPLVKNGSNSGTAPPIPKHRQMIDEEGDTYQNMGSKLPDSHDIPVTDIYKIVQAEHEDNPTHPFREEFDRVGSPELVCKIGRIPNNVAKNSFKNITATDENRVKLDTSHGYDSDYVNANYIKDYNGRELFIASQGPIKTTMEDMWRLIHDTTTSTIVMLTNPIEAGKLKCAVYWPEDTGKQTIGSFTITLVEERQFAEYVVRKLKYAFKNGPARHVKHFHFTQWPDHGVPTTSGLLSLRHRVKQDMNSHSNAVIIHCSDGVGRTGTFIGLDLLVDEAHDSKKSRHQTINVMRCVHNMRLQRTQMVQTATQYSFLYSIVSEALSCGDTAVVCSKFQSVLDKWKQPRRGNPSILKDQFNKTRLSSPILKPTAYSHGNITENQGKNRDESVLPLDNARVILAGKSSPDDYINAITVDSYQTRRGFIATQTPLPDTRADFWSLIMEKKTSVIVYLNDCLDEDLYWPDELDTPQTYSGIKVKCLSSNKIDERAADGLNATEATLLCSTSSKITHEVLHIEVEMRSSLPSAAQLVSLCTKLEKYVTSGRDVVTVLCRNGSRLTGLLIVALNLYQRARIEQEVDIVLELKLARRSRPQFIPDYESFELLYDFVSSYLSRFNNYSTFGVK